MIQMPRCPDLAISVLTDDDRQTDTTNYFDPCACALGNKLRLVLLYSALLTSHGWSMAA